MPRHALAAIPVFNEERHLASVIRSVERHVREVLVIDDGSTDSTPQRLRDFPQVHVIRHPENRGYGLSLADAFSYAIRRGHDWLITLDGDGQHEADLIPLFLEAASEDDADILSGTRYPEGHDVESARATAPPDRRRINHSITALLNRDWGLGLTDAFCGFKAYRVSALRKLRITIPGYAMPMQLWVQAAREGMRIREIPVDLRYPDPNRHFGGLLDDPAIRLQHYLDVYRGEIETPSVCSSRPVMQDMETCSCRTDRP